jgi:hypothetical protein
MAGMRLFPLFPGPAVLEPLGPPSDAWDIPNEPGTYMILLVCFHSCYHTITLVILSS